MPIQPARRMYRTWSWDSTHWQRYRPRRDDIVIATYPKCGTTWMQRIVGLLVFQSPEPRPIMQISPWLDRRFISQPVDATLATIEAQTHRRFLKSHLPLDGLPLHDEVRYIHVARDGRDAAMSYHNHGMALTAETLAAFDRVGLEDEAIGRPYPRMPADPAVFFHRWLTQGVVPGDGDGSPMMSFFHFERTWWEARRRANVLLVHYDDLKADLSGEMRRVAAFLGISVAPKLWPALVAAAGFKAMRRDGGTLMGSVAASFAGGSGRFFHQGTNGRWRGVFRDADLARYEAKVAAMLPAACARWTACGRLAAGDPRSAAD
jgi:aryl sulfotransferase